jgi:uncharacterized membrane protein YecN with MAPEG domain
MNKIARIAKKVGVEYITIIAILNFIGSFLMAIYVLYFAFILGRPVSVNGVESDAFLWKSVAILLCVFVLMVSGSYLFYFRKKLIALIETSEGL